LNAKKKSTSKNRSTQLVSGNWWDYNNRGMAMEDIGRKTIPQDCGKEIDFTPPSSHHLDFTPTTFKTKTSQLTGAFLGMTEQFKQSLFRPR